MLSMAALLIELPLQPLDFGAQFIFSSRSWALEWIIGFVNGG